MGPQPCLCTQIARMLNGLSSRHHNNPASSKLAHCVLWGQTKLILYTCCTGFCLWGKIAKREGTPLRKGMRAFCPKEHLSLFVKEGVPTPPMLLPAKYVEGHINANASMCYISCKCYHELYYSLTLHMSRESFCDMSRDLNLSLLGS